MKRFKQYILEEEKPVEPVVSEPIKDKKKPIKPPVEEPLEPIEIEAN